MDRAYVKSLATDEVVEVLDTSNQTGYIAAREAARRDGAPSRIKWHYGKPVNQARADAGEPIRDWFDWEGKRYEFVSNDTNSPVEKQREVSRPLSETPSDTQATPPAPAPRADPSDDLEWLLRETLWSRAEIDDVLDTLRTRRPQIILAGPPGTGKTWVAERIGRFLTGRSSESVEVVQFHPSYAYEDFVEGLRPVAREGQVAFEVVPGALVNVADHARRVDHPVVLVIDEMNRANLPSVFGELLYLLEYRGKEIRLLHRDRFSLPPNLYVIGTMNTADRSIRSVDTALRRRFDIFECPPRPDIVDSYYRSADHRSEVVGLAHGLRKLNDLLIQHLDHHHTVGHSFLMAKHFTDKDLHRTWLRQIRPLIDEYFFDQPDLVAQFTLPLFWPSLSLNED